MMKNQNAVRFVEVTREHYWFGHRAYAKAGPPGSRDPSAIEKPYLLALDNGPVYGVAIADASEVRGVRLASFDQGASLPGEGYAGPYLELVEGQPLALQTSEDPTLLLDRLDWTDGRLVLALALTPDAVALLPRTVKAQGELRIDAETYFSGVAVRLHVPRIIEGELSSTLIAYNSHAVTALNITERFDCIAARALRPVDEALSAVVEVAAGNTCVASTRLISESTGVANFQHADLFGLQFDADTPAAFSARVTLVSRRF